MASLNINSLLAYIDEFRIFMSEADIDIISINETKLDSLINDYEVYIPGYEIVRKDRKTNGRHGGGVYIYVRCNLNYKIYCEDLSFDELEYLTVKITKPRTKPLLISTWYKPPDSPMYHFDYFENIVEKVNMTNHDYFLLGDINVNLMPGVTSVNATKLNDIFEIFGLSDHVLVYMTHKVHYKQTGSRLIEIRNMKILIMKIFLRDLERQRWSDVNLSNDPNEMWAKWKNMLINCIDKHAPLRTKKVGKKKSPWITSQLKQSMHKRDSLKKKDKQTSWRPINLATI